MHVGEIPQTLGIVKAAGPSGPVGIFLTGFTTSFIFLKEHYFTFTPDVSIYIPKLYVLHIFISLILFSNL